MYLTIGLSAMMAMLCFTIFRQRSTIKQQMDEMPDHFDFELSERDLTELNDSEVFEETTEYDN